MELRKFALWLLLDRINNGHKAVTRMELDRKSTRLNSSHCG